MKTIQEVAKEFNVSTRTIRYYEELGLLAQVGTLENHRASRCKADLHSRRCRAPGVVLKGQGECLHMPSQHITS